MSEAYDQNTPAEEGGASAPEPGRKHRGGTVLIVLLLFGLFVLWYMGAVSINRMIRQVEDLESALGETQSALAAASQELAGLREELEEKADKEEVQKARLKDREPIVRAVAHRGYSTEAPENTLPAFERAMREGFRYVETDIRFTLDGVAVCLHDDTVDRTSDGSGAIGAMRLEEARRLDFGSWKGEEFAGTQIPTADEFLRLCRSLGLRPYLELKTGDQTLIRNLVSLVKTFDMADEVTWISFSGELLYYVAHYDPSARLGLLCAEASRDAITQTMRLRTGLNSIFIDTASASDEICRLCMENGIPLEFWTLDEEDDILALNPYVSGVTSDSLLAGEILADAILNGER